MVDLARELTGGSFAGGVRVGVLGAAFKPNSDDVRDSPALDVAEAIRLQGAHVRVYDPQANANAATNPPAAAPTATAPATRSTARISSCT